MEHACDPLCLKIPVLAAATRSMGLPYAVLVLGQAFESSPLGVAVTKQVLQPAHRLIRRWIRAQVRFGNASDWLSLHRPVRFSPPLGVKLRRDSQHCQIADS